MSERKCYSKYEKMDAQYQKKLISNKLKKKKIRFMLPINIKCELCFNKIPKGKKLNAIKEKILNKNYLGINFLRFYIRCSDCFCGASIITDLKGLKYKPEINCIEI